MVVEKDVKNLIVLNQLKVKLIFVHHMVVEKDVKNPIVLNQHLVKLIFVHHMVVEKDVLIVSFGLIVELEVLSMTGTAQLVSKDYFLMTQEVR